MKFRDFRRFQELIKSKDFKWFHEIQPNLLKSNGISWNLQNFTAFHKIQDSWNPAGLHRISWNLLEFHVKSKKIHYRFLDKFQEIQHNFTKSKRISWNSEISKDFMKISTGFHKIQRFQMTSWNTTGFHWNQQDFIWILLWIPFHWNM